MFWSLPKGQTRPAIDPVVIAQSMVSSQNASYNLSVTQSFHSLAVCGEEGRKQSRAKEQTCVYSYMEKNISSKIHFDMQIFCLSALIAQNTSRDNDFLVSARYFGEATSHLGCWDCKRCSTEEGGISCNQNATFTFLISKLHDTLKRHFLHTMTWTSLWSAYI